MDKEKRAVHRMSVDDSAVIQELIEADLAPRENDTEGIKKEKLTRMNAYRDYLSSMSGTLPKKRKNKRILCYEDLPNIVDITGISFFDILQKVSVDPNGNKIFPRWPNETEAKMCAYCDLMTEHQQDKVLFLIKGVLAPFFETVSHSTNSPIMRLYRANTMRNYCTKELMRQAVDLGVGNVYRRRYMPYNYNALELNLVSFMAISFDVSPHWILSLDEKHTVLAAKEKTEAIMDLFCLLPTNRKEMILKAAETYITHSA